MIKLLVNIQLDMHGLKSFNCVNSHQEVITKVLSFPGRLGLAAISFYCTVYGIIFFPENVKMFQEQFQHESCLEGVTLMNAIFNFNFQPK